MRLQGFLRGCPLSLMSMRCSRCVGHVKRSAKIHANVLIPPQWIATSGIVPSYDGRQGCWRPDYLFSSAQEPSQPVICEINARFPYNAWVIVPLASQSMTKNMDLAKGGLKTGHSYAVSTILSKYWFMFLTDQRKQ